MDPEYIDRILSIGCSRPYLTTPHFRLHIPHSVFNLLETTDHEHAYSLSVRVSHDA